MGVPCLGSDFLRAAAEAMAAQEPWPDHLLLLAGALPCTDAFYRAAVEQIQADGELMASAAGALALAHGPRSARWLGRRTAGRVPMAAACCSASASLPAGLGEPVDGGARLLGYLNGTVTVLSQQLATGTGPCAGVQHAVDAPCALVSTMFGVEPRQGGRLGRPHRPLTLDMANLAGVWRAGGRAGRGARAGHVRGQAGMASGPRAGGATRPWPRQRGCRGARSAPGAMEKSAHLRKVHT